jgi:hypothetical protein
VQSNSPKTRLFPVDLYISIDATATGPCYFYENQKAKQPVRPCRIDSFFPIVRFENPKGGLFGEAIIDNPNK